MELNEKFKNNLKKISNLSTQELGKMPPQSVDLEKIVLGAIILEKGVISEVLDILNTECFYDNKHQHIYAAIRKLFDNNKPNDTHLVAQQLQQDGKLNEVGGISYLIELTSLVESSANVVFHSRIIQEKYLLRQLISISSEIQTKAYDPTSDVFELMETSEQKLFSVAENTLRSNYKKISTIISETLQTLYELKEKESNNGVASGLRALDSITTGFQPSDLIILAARPGMGKTALALTILRNAAILSQKKIALFSLEMSSLNLCQRLLSSEADIELYKIRNALLSNEELLRLEEKGKKISNLHITIDETPQITIQELRARCRRFKVQDGLDMVIIDYLQLMSGARDGKVNFNREQEIGNISRSLKGLAKELNVPVLALAQLSRDVEKRPDKRPILSDLRESGSIEQDADQVMFIYREAKYNKEGDDNATVTDLAEIILEKNRHGATGTAVVRFIDRFAKFVDTDGGDNLKILKEVFGEDSYSSQKSIRVNSKANDNEDADAPF